MTQHLATCHCEQCLEEDRQAALHSKDGVTTLFAVLEDAADAREAVAVYLRNVDDTLLRRAILAIANYRFGEAEVQQAFDREGHDAHRNCH